MILIYCKYAGMPYKSDQHYTNLKHCGYVSSYWTIEFILKLITAFIPAVSPDNIGNAKHKSKDDTISDSQQLFYVICYFSLCVTCDIVPYLIVVDSQFIKIFTFDLIRKFTQE